MREITKVFQLPFYDHFNGLELEEELPGTGMYVSKTSKKGGKLHVSRTSTT